MGYPWGEMGHTSELRLPADRAYVVVAKRAAAALGSVGGFDVEAIDDLSIAVSQAFENAVSCLEQAGALAGQVRLGFKLGDKSLEVSVRSTVSREAELAAREARQRALAEQREQQVAAATDLALRLMGLFVDDSSYRLDERTGGLRVRLTKYRVS
jgi:anti-sigma regulatory factor (Ser/Thr protein kinase)